MPITVLYDMGVLISDMGVPPILLAFYTAKLNSPSPNFVLIYTLYTYSPFQTKPMHTYYYTTYNLSPPYTPPQFKKALKIGNSKL